MATSHFQRQLLPPPKVFYERELGKLSRPRRGWALGRCPFHQSKSGKSFSVNLESGGFHCFGCDARGGDVLSFLRQRDGLSFKEAAQRLGAWDEAPSPETVRKLAERTRERDQQRQVEQEREAEERRRRLALRDEIHANAAFQREISDRLSEIQQGASEAYPGEADDCWGALAAAYDNTQLTEAEYCAAAGLEYTE